MPDLSDDQKNRKNERSEYINKFDISIEKHSTTSGNNSAYNIPKAGSIGNEIIDIMDSPDIAVWSKAITNKIRVPADKVKEPSKVELAITEYIIKDYEEKHSGKVLAHDHLKEEVPVDAANRKDVSKVVDLGATLTDEASFV